MPGFVRNQVLRPGNLDDPYIVLTIWKSKLILKHGSIQRRFNGPFEVRHSAEGDVFGSQ